MPQRNLKQREQSLQGKGSYKTSSWLQSPFDSSKSTETITEARSQKYRARERECLSRN